jgi:phosphatidate cytidylyltransferase
MQETEKTETKDQQPVRKPTPMAVRTTLGVVLSAGLAVLLWLDSLWPQGYVFAVSATLILTLALVEFARLAHAAGYKVDVPVLTVGGATVFLLNWAGWASPHQFPGPWLAGVAGLSVMLVAVFAGRIVRSRVEGSLGELGTTMAGLLYLPLLFTFLSAIRLSPCEGDAPVWGIMGLVTTIAVCKAGSVGAYFVGKTLGKHQMSPVVSPNKTVEGAVGALLAGLLVSVALSLTPWSIMPQTRTVAWAVAFGLLVALAGMLGDLTASLLKREAGIKDSGHLLPGFGGMMDMLDDILVGAPVAFFLLAWAHCL